MLFSYASILVGAVLVVVAALLGGFAAGWTFLRPLPFYTAGGGGPGRTDSFFVGLLLVGAGFFVYCIDLLLEQTSRHVRRAAARARHLVPA